MLPQAVETSRTRVETSFCLRYAFDMFAVGADLSDWRHSYVTHLKADGEDVKVIQEFLRHANSRITLDTYTQALRPAKREAQTKVVRMILPQPIQTAVAAGEK